MKPNSLLMDIIIILDDYDYTIITLDTSTKKVLCKDKSKKLVCLSFEEILKMFC